jgi:glycerol-3-phosphate dehydrogenase
MASTFSVKTRSRDINHLETTQFDMIIIGGGITGAGILLDAQLRGLNCCLIEMQDFSEGTSSRSTKLIHGGLRYLKQFNFKLVNETGKERNTLAHIARHLTRRKKVMLPAIKNGSFSKLQLRVALWIYEKFARVPKGLRHSSYSADDFTKAVPGINKNDLLGGVEYIEFQSNDSRLTIEVLKKGVEKGGVALSRIKVLELICGEKKKITGVAAIDTLTEEKINIKGDCVINATGPWSDKLFPDNSNSVFAKLKPTKGVHLVFDEKRFKLSRAVYFDTPDGRMIFAIPEAGRVYVGTTDTFFEGDIRDPGITNKDVSYLLDACNNMFPGFELKCSDITGGWSGVRPLIHQANKKPSEISRKYETIYDKAGLFTIVGGKLTGYRKMAKKIVDRAVHKKFSTRELNDCSTADCELSGSDFKGEDHFKQVELDFLAEAKREGWNRKDAQWVFQHFGSQSFRILQNNVTTEDDIPEYLVKSLLYTLSYEMTMSPADFFVRRTNLFHFNPAIVEEHYGGLAEILYDFMEASSEYRSKENTRFAAMLASIQRIQNGL